MQLTKSTQKAKRFIYKTIQSLTSFFFEGYQNLPKSPSLNPFTSCTTTHKNHLKDHFPYQWEAHDHDLNKSMEKNAMLSSKESVSQQDACSNSKQIVSLKKKQELGGLKKQKMRGSYSREPSSRHVNGGSYGLAQKMKELDMVDEGDLEHVLDVEEALHYYSRLRSPVYLDIVDNFFLDMYSEFNVPQHTSTICISKRRKRII